MNLLTKHEFTLSYPDNYVRAGEVISGDVRFVDDGTPKPLIVISHGYKTCKDWGMFPVTGEYFAQKGFVSIALNYARDGVKPGEKRITEWDIFATNSPSLEIDDLHFLLNAIDDGALEYYGVDVYDQPCILLGHSGGAAVTLVTAAEREDITAAILWSSIAKFDRFTQEEKALWRKQGWLEFMSDEEHGIVKIGVESLNDIENNKDRLDVLAAAQRIKIPVYILHGTDDPTVSIEEAKQLTEILNNPLHEYEFIDGIGHLFGMTPPYAPELKPQLKNVLDKTNDWLQRVLEEKSIND